MRYRLNTRSNPIISGCIIGFVGLVFAVVGTFFLMDTLRFLPGTITANGTIVQCKDSGGENSSCQPVVNFTTQSGQQITFNSSFSSSSFNEGEAVTVRYHPNNPHDARIDSFVSTWLFPVIFGGLGLIVLLLGFFTLLRGILRRMLF